MRPSGEKRVRGAMRGSRTAERLRERTRPLLDTASHYTELRYGLRPRVIAGFATALVVVLAWPILRHFRRRR